MRIIVNNIEYHRFTRFSINQSFNSIASSFEIVSNKKLFDYFLDMPKCEIYNDNNELLITGLIFAPKIQESTKPDTISYSGYTSTGILEDCNIPIDAYPLQYDKLNLKQITEKLLNPFGIKYLIEGDIDKDFVKAYEKITVEPTTSVKQLLSDLASQRNIYLSHTAKGELLFTRINPKKSKSNLQLVEGGFGIKNISLQIDTQKMHSKITVLKQATKESPDSAEYTIINPYVEKYKPTVIVANSGSVFDIQKSARNALTAELSGIKIEFQTTKYAKPGSIIELTAPSIGLNRATELFVSEVQTTGTVKDDDYFSYSCVLADLYKEGEIKNIFK